MQLELSPHPTRKSWIAISLDGDFWRHIHTAIFGFRPSLPKKCHSEREFSEQFATLEYRQAKNYAIKRLSLMSLPSTKLAASLKERLVSDDVIIRLIDELSTAGYLNDKEWVASFIRVQSRRNMGPRAIAQKLAAKELSSDWSKEMVAESLSEDAQRSAIKHLLTTRYRSRNLADPREKKKVIASLIRRGFDISIVFNCLTHSDF